MTPASQEPKLSEEIEELVAVAFRKLFEAPGRHDEDGDRRILCGLARAILLSERRRCAQVVEALSSYDGTGCRDKAHDDRWCSSCENRNDALTEAAEAIRAIEEAPHDR